jgi:hypothetical protein
MTATTPITTPSKFEAGERAPRRRGPWQERVDGIHLLKLVGSHYEMGKQHGAMLRDEVRRGPIPYYRTYLERMMGRAGLGALAPLAWTLVQRGIGDRVARAFPDYALDAIRGLADGAQLDYDELLEGCSLPDSLLWVASKVMGLRGVGPAMHHRLALGLGCTSAIAWGDATSDGKLLHARNLDYHGVDCWPSTTAVIFHEPDDGLRYVSVGAAGVVMGGVTAMNEAGLTLTVHQHMFTAETQLGGMPVGCVGDRIMREARSLDDAEAILRQQRPIGCWTYLITDGPRREVLCWEENPERNVVAHRGTDGGTFGYANIYLDRELGDTERNLYASYWRHNLGRYQRVHQLLDDGFGQHDPQTMSSILADQGDSACRISAAIGMVMTVGSVVFSPEDGLLWVGTGKAPTSHRRFVAFDLNGERHASEAGDLTGGVDGDATSAAAYEHYRDAYIAYVDDNDVDAARRHVRRACASQPEQPLFQCLEGLLALSAGDAEVAFDALGRALAIGHPHPERIATFHLWRGRAADLNGRRDEAMRDYRAALGMHSDRPVFRAARRGLKRAYTAKEARRVGVDMTYVDVINP